MTGIAWLVLVLSVLIPVAFWLGRKVERELLVNETFRQISALKTKQEQELTRENW